jgi:hypothetical protein
MLEHWLLKAFHSLGGILKDAAAADRKALNNQASAPLKHLELRNSGLFDSGFFLAFALAFFAALGFGGCLGGGVGRGHGGFDFGLPGV